MGVLHVVQEPSSLKLYYVQHSVFFKTINYYTCHYQQRNGLEPHTVKSVCTGKLYTVQVTQLYQLQFKYSSDNYKT